MPIKIAAHLNDEGVTSWTGKRFYPELVFGVIRKARLKAERVVGSFAIAISCNLMNNHDGAKKKVAHGSQLNLVNLFKK